MFYETSLCLEDRILNMSVVRTVLLSWKEAVTKLKGRSKHMPTCQTFDDAIIAEEGLTTVHPYFVSIKSLLSTTLYILIVAADNSDEHIMSWLFASDACEQLYAFLCI